jgi:hypothetical protein
VLRGFSQHEFDGNTLAELHVAIRKDDTHASHAERALDLVFASEDLARRGNARRHSFLLLAQKIFLRLATSAYTATVATTHRPRIVPVRMAQFAVRIGPRQ